MEGGRDVEGEEGDGGDEDERSVEGGRDVEGEDGDGGDELEGERSMEGGRDVEGEDGGGLGGDEVEPETTLDSQTKAARRDLKNEIRKAKRKTWEEFLHKADGNSI